MCARQAAVWSAAALLAIVAAVSCSYNSSTRLLPTDAHSTAAPSCRILVVSVTDLYLWKDHGFRLLVGSLGASAVLVYGVPESKLSQPRNLVGRKQRTAAHRHHIFHSSC